MMKGGGPTATSSRKGLRRVHSYLFCPGGGLPLGVTVTQFGFPPEQPPVWPPGFDVDSFPAITWSNCVSVSFTGSALAATLSAPQVSSDRTSNVLIASSCCEPWSRRRQVFPLARQGSRLTRRLFRRTGLVKIDH